MGRLTAATCADCGKKMYGDNYGPLGHQCDGSLRLKALVARIEDLSIGESLELCGELHSKGEDRIALAVAKIVVRKMEE